ncbi:SDR family oxidoreductase [Microbacterium sp. zg-Y818]|uniref:SDR family NAD(P)-dependent oxidoreductase n=1 Tax=unclassified Microbacterium TaxID=2609290 RepID=UPI00214BCB48|nr:MULTISPECIES: SDR family oxidoreductase [unclassified Microbacterium]MCR2799385.1 SDR family oxidoreductase [Microbacterium sp. zg.Y818]WIM21384.1 SDR family oxidoreductase [Microbacterium sp. zg-Y818]
MQIRHRVFVVTGAGNGMGREVAIGLIRKGAKVAAVDLRADGLAGTARLADAGDRLSTHVVDVTDRAAVSALPDAVVARHGVVDGVVNIAGVIHRFAYVADLEEAETDRVMRINFDGTVNVCRAFLPALKARPEAVLANMSSLSALIPFASQTVYGASKGAVKQFSEGLYAELHGSGVQVCTIFPGNVSTDLTVNSGVTMIDAGTRAVRATTPAAAGRKILQGIEKGRFRILVGQDAMVLDALVRISPGGATRFVARQMKSVMPA